jgi:hypothetical protein
MTIQITDEQVKRITKLNKRMHGEHPIEIKAFIKDLLFRGLEDCEYAQDELDSDTKEGN